MNPVISVIIPARNAEATLADALASLTRQTLPDWEAIVVNDASNDRTVGIADEHAHRDRRIKRLDGPGAGASAARNLGLSAVGGELLLFLDSDDWIAPDFLAKMTQALAGAPDAIAAFCADRRVTPKGELATFRWCEDIARAPFEVFARRCGAAIHAVLIKRSVVMEVGGFDTRLRTGEDWDLWQRVARTGGRFVGVPEALAFYRMSQSSLTGDTLQLIADARTIIGRGFAADPRVPRPAPAYAEGSRYGGADAALAYFVLWCAAVEAARGHDGVKLLRSIGPLPDLKDHFEQSVAMFLDALMVGARNAQAGLVRRWGAFGGQLRALLTACGEASSRPGLDRRLQYAIERELLRHADLAVEAPLGLTMGMRVDLRRLAALEPPSGIDLLHIRFCTGAKVLAIVERPVFGRMTAGEFADLAIEALGRQAYWEAARPHLSARWWLKASGKLAAGLGRLARGPRANRASLRPAFGKAGWSAAPGAQDPLVQPGSSRARFEALICDERRKGEIAAGGERKRAVLPQRVETDGANDRRSYWEAFFETPDPWDYGSDYEQTKYRRTLGLVPPGIQRALELACAEGRFTELLAGRVEQLVAADISRTALERARERLKGFAHVELERLDLCVDPLPGGLDLIVCSEVLYYLDDEAELARTCRKLAEALAPGGRLLSAHSFVLKDDLDRTGFDWDAPFGAKVISQAMSATPGLALERSIRTELYRIDLLRRLDAGEQPCEPSAETMPTGADLTPDVARFVLWGGAAARRADLAASECSDHVPVLMYHRVAADGPPALSSTRVHPERFLAQMRWLRRHGYHAVTSSDLAERLAAGRPFAGRPVMLTFDDGTQDFDEIAWPILRESDFSAEVFVVTDLAGKAALWDAEYGPPAPLMDPAKIQALGREGVRFGSHLATHRAADSLSSRELVAELVRSRAMLETWLGRAVHSFAAPFGFVDERLIRTADLCGYRIGFTTQNGVVGPGAHPLRLPRIDIRGDWPIETFIETLEGTR